MQSTSSTGSVSDGSVQPSSVYCPYPVLIVRQDLNCCKHRLQVIAGLVQRRREVKSCMKNERDQV